MRKRPRGSSSRLVICDSKEAYAAGGPALLERATLGFLAACGYVPDTLSALLAHTGLTGDTEPNTHGPWHRPESLRVPAHVAAEDVADAADRLACGFASIGGRCERLWVNAASPGRFNRLVHTTGNKATALFALAADILGAGRHTWPEETVHVTMDCHGRRQYYADLLTEAFPLVTVQTREESRGLSRYDLVCDGPDGRPAPMRLTIAQKCERLSLPTALASMAAKYVRELHMHQLNAYFQALVPDLRPTAGYGRDAWRFLEDVAPARATQGVPDTAILRCR